MSGNTGGLRAKFRDFTTSGKLLFIHCMAHKLELSVGHAMKQVKSKTDFDFAEDILTFYINGIHDYFGARAVKRKNTLLETCERMEIKRYQLHRVFDARWASTENVGIDSIMKMYSCLIKTLEKVDDEGNVLRQARDDDLEDNDILANEEQKQITTSETEEQITTPASEESEEDGHDVQSEDSEEEVRMEDSDSNNNGEETPRKSRKRKNADVYLEAITDANFFVSLAFFQGVFHILSTYSFAYQQTAAVLPGQKQRFNEMRGKIERLITNGTEQLLPFNCL